MAKPVVDGLERQLEDQMQVLRLSVMDDVGGALARRYSVRAIPTFVLLDGAGEVVLTQIGVPDRDAIRSAVAQMVTR